MTGPLAGMRVIDVTTNISGPTLTMILADLGAEIIKIERPGTGDDARGMGPFMSGEGVYFLHINRNKESVVIDLKKQDGKQIVYDLVKSADIFVENFRQGKAEQMGLGYAKLKAINNQIIYCSLSAYGQSGPQKLQPGYDAIAQAETGIMGINGAKDAELARVPVSILDQGSAMWGAIGILSALLHRKHTGEGQFVSTSLYETGLFWSSYHMLSFLATGEEPQKNGSGHTAFAPYGAYLASDTYIMIGISNQSLFERLCRVLNSMEWLSDQRFLNNKNRVENQYILKENIELILQRETADYWVTELSAAGIPSSKVKKISEVIDAKQTEALGMWQQVTHDTIEDLRLPRLPFHLSKSTPEVKMASPKLGENTDCVLQSLGYTQERIAELSTSQVIGAYEKKLKNR